MGIETAPVITANQQPMLLSLGKAAKRLGLGRHRVRELVRNGELRSVQVNRVWSFVQTKDLEEFIARRVNQEEPTKTNAVKRGVSQPTKSAKAGTK